MLLGRPTALWNGLVLAAGALVVLIVKFVAPAVDVASLVAGVVALAAAAIALLANQAVNGSFLGRRP